ncbi:hypothetical protein QJS10_CPA03g02381 [Acorus calamus]|uniref:Uncharacterized protein n=1 Tax=Acorus calamus TaxID=4465 RepID=A0AAV9F567_ACOCL|nr:hypothetical protein QJS10_CPA03g02381 [Acorus calamus]
MNSLAQGNVIGPSPGNPNSSADISRSSRMMSVFKYSQGTTNRLPSDVYTMKWPLFVVAVVTKASDSSEPRYVMMIDDEVLLLREAAALHHFLAISLSLSGLSISFPMIWV